MPAEGEAMRNGRERLGWRPLASISEVGVQLKNQYSKTTMGGEGGGQESWPRASSNFCHATVYSTTIPISPNIKYIYASMTC